jgi:hypothetical protein
MSKFEVYREKVEAELEIAQAKPAEPKDRAKSSTAEAKISPGKPVGVCNPDRNV